MSFRTFMGSIGNAFKTGWNNGNIQKGMAITGMAAFGVGMTANLVHDMKRGGSIFGGGCGCNSFGFGGNMFGCSPFSMGGMDMFGSSPFSMMGSMNMFGTGNMFGGGMDTFGGMNMLNGMGNMYGMGGMNNMGNMMAYQWGQQLAMQQQMQMGSMYPNMNLNNNLLQQPELEQLSYEHSEATEIGSSVTDAKGKEFDEGTTALGTDSDADDVTIASDVTNGRKGDKDKYRTDLKEIAQSHAKQIGGSDGKIDFDEYYAHEIDSFREQFPNASDEQLEMMIKNAFIQMDLNGDGDIDWQEMASSIATYDSAGSSSGKLDGKISKSDYSSAQRAIIGGTFGKANWDNYKLLFPESVEKQE